MFDGVEIAEQAHADIDWDEYILEAVNQLSGEALPEFKKPKAPSSSQINWYLFKNKEVHMLILLLDLPVFLRIGPRKCDLSKLN